MRLSASVILNANCEQMQKMCDAMFSISSNIRLLNVLSKFKILYFVYCKVTIFNI